MNTDTEQTVPPSRKNWLGPVALLFALAPPIILLLAIIQDGLREDRTVLFFFTLLCSSVAVVCGSVAHAKETKNGRMGYWAIRIGGTQYVLLLLSLSESFLFTGLIAIVCGVVARFKSPKTGSGRFLTTVLDAALVVIFVPWIALLVLQIWTVFVPSDGDAYRVRKRKSEDNLKQLYCFMSIYGQNFNCYPSMQSTNDVPRCNGGVRDLYPLYLSAPDKPPFLELLKPPGVKLVPFSKNPGADEFDSAHIGYIYNSTVVPDQSNNPPLMAERCVEDGKFTTDEKPVFNDCAHILMANGTVSKVPVKNGKLILPPDIKLEDLGKLK